jgi:ubiquinone/menaquinone biosynthesis C-methylase UbiE
VHEPAEKNGLRAAWGRVAEVYGGLWAERTAHVTGRGLDLLAPAAGANGVDVACGPGLTTVALAERLAGGGALGVDFAAEMVECASKRFGGRDDLSFAVDDAERLSLAPASVDVVTCSFGLMYCYDAAAALHSAGRTLRPGGRMLQVVWGRATNVWWVPVIELIESRAQYFSAVCPMMFFYGLPGVMPRMIDEAGLDLVEQITLETAMAFADVDDAVEAAIHGGPLAGLYRHRLDADAQAEVREAMRAHVEAVATAGGDGIQLPAEASLTVASRPAGMS